MDILFMTERRPRSMIQPPGAQRLRIGVPARTMAMLSTALVAAAMVSPTHGETPPANAPLRALIEHALNEPGGITVENTTIAKAIDLISEQTGVRFVMSDDTMNLLPQGPNTRIQRVEIANMPLRDGLDRLFAPMGMTFAVRRDFVEIEPRECLRALDRPATWEELDVLTELAASEPGVDETALAALRSRVQFQIPVRNGWSLLAGAIRDVGAGRGNEVLSIACRNLGWTWSVSSGRIVIADRTAAVRRRLARRITLKMNNRPLLSVLKAVGQRVAVGIRVEPGLLASLPAHLQQSFSLAVHEDTAEQVLDTIAAYTGLGYLINANGVLFYGSTPDAKTDARPLPTPDSAPDGDPVVAKITHDLGDGKTVDWLIRRSELPENLRSMRQRELAALIEAARRDGENHDQ